MRKAFKIVLATGVILGLAWISIALATVFFLVFLFKVVLARGGLPERDVTEEDFLHTGPYVGPPLDPDAQNLNNHDRFGTKIDW